MRSAASVYPCSFVTRTGMDYLAAANNRLPPLVSKGSTTPRDMILDKHIVNWDFDRAFSLTNSFFFCTNRKTRIYKGGNRRRYACKSPICCEECPLDKGLSSYDEPSRINGRRDQSTFKSIFS